MYLGICALSSIKVIGFCRVLNGLRARREALNGKAHDKLKESWTARQRRYQSKPLFELGLPKRPVPYQRRRPIKKGILALKEYSRAWQKPAYRFYFQATRIAPMTR
jgi:hypothetical protein